MEDYARSTNRFVYEKLKDEMKKSNGAVEGQGRYQSYIDTNADLFRAWLDSVELRQLGGESVLLFRYDVPKPGLMIPLMDGRVAVVACERGRYATYAADKPEPTTLMLRAAPDGPGMGEMLRQICGEAGRRFATR